MAALAVLPAAYAPAQDITLVSNTGQPGDTWDFLGVQIIWAQDFTAGSHDLGYNLTSIAVQFTQARTNSDLTVTVREASGTYPSATARYTLTGPQHISVGLNTFTAPAGAVLESGKRYFVVLSRGSKTYDIERKTSGDEDMGGAAGWSIGNNRYWYTSQWGTTADQQLGIAVRGSLVPAGGAKPVFSSAAVFTVAENTTAVGTVAAADEDAEDSVTGYAITGGADRTQFAIAATTGALTFAVAPDYENAADSGSDNEYEVTVTATSGAGERALTAEQPITVRVTDVNESPAFSSAAAFTVAENTTAVGTVTAADPEGDPVTVALDAGGDAGSFSFDGTTGALRFKTAPDYETRADADGDNEYEVSFTATSGSGAAFRAVRQSVTVTVTDVVPPPAPANLMATPDFFEVALSWATADGAVIDKHQYQRKEGDGAYGAWLDIPASAGGAANAASYTVTGLTDGTAYAFRVRAANGEGDGPQSAAATATTRATTVEGTITRSSTSWKLRGPVRVRQGGTYTYTMTRTGSYVVFESFGLLSPTLPTTRLSSAGAGACAGESGTAYFCFSFTGSHTSLTGTVDDHNYAVRLLLDASPYTITLKVSAYTPTGTTVLLGIVGGYRVLEKRDGHLTLSVAEAVTAAPSAPANLEAVAGYGAVALTWTRGLDEDISRHQYRRKEGSGEYGAWLDIPNSAAGQANDESYTVRELSHGTEYTFRVRATNLAGDGAASNEASATPLRSTPEVSIAARAGGATVTEGTAAVFTLRRSEPLAAELAVEVSVSVTGAVLATEVGGVAYAAPDEVTFAAGQDSATLSVATQADEVDEPDGVVRAQVTAAAGYTVGTAGSAEVTVSDDDAARFVLGIAAPATVDEDAGTVTVTVTATTRDNHAPAQAARLALAFRTEAQSATAGADYAPPSALQVTLAAAQFTANAERTAFEASHGYLITIVDDAAAEPPETIVMAAEPVGTGVVGSAEHTLTIVDDEALPVLSIGDAAASESAGGMEFAVRLNGSSRTEVTVSYAAADGTGAAAATAGSDYRATSGTLTIAAGAAHGTLSVPLIDNVLDDGDKTFTVTLSDPKGATLAGATATGTILDDEGPDAASPIRIMIRDAAGIERNRSLEFAVRLNGSSLTEVTVQYTTADGSATAGADYTAMNGVLTIAAFKSYGTIRIPIVDDAEDEIHEGRHHETFTVTLSNPRGAVLEDATATGTIADDDVDVTSNPNSIRVLIYPRGEYVDQDGRLKLIAGKFKVGFIFVDPQTPIEGMRLDGFTPADVMVSGGTRGATFENPPWGHPGGPPLAYVLEITPEDANAVGVTVTVAAGVAEHPDHPGLGNAATSWSSGEPLKLARARAGIPLLLVVAGARDDGRVVLDAAGSFEVSFIFVDPETFITGVPMTGFTPADVEVRGAAKAAAFATESYDGSVYRLRLQADPEAAEVTVKVAAGSAGAAADASLVNEAGALRVRLLRAPRPEAPAVAIGSTAPEPVSGRFEVEFRFSREVTGFTWEEIEVGNGAVWDEELTRVDGASYRASIEPAADFAGTVTVDLAAGAAQAADGALSAAAQQLRVAADRVAPAVTVTSAAAAPVTGEIAVVVRFSEATTGLRMAELAIANGYAARMASRSDGSEHTVYVAPHAGARGELTVTVPAGVAADAAGNPNTASEPLRIALAAAGPITGFTLFDSGSGQDLAELTEGRELEVIASSRLNIRAEIAADAAVGSVRLELSGAQTSARTENHAPYALFGDRGGRGLPAGAYRISATPYAERELGGAPGPPLSVAFTVGRSAAEAGVAVTGVAVTSSPANGAAYAVGEEIEVAVRFGAPVTVETADGTPTIGLKLDAAARAAGYASGTGTAALRFVYRVTEDDGRADEVRIVAHSLTLNGGTIRAGDGTDADLSFETAPVVSGVAITSGVGAGGVYGVGETVAVTVWFSRTVTVATAEGRPAIGLLVGVAARVAEYASGTDTAALRFVYTVTEDDGAAGGVRVVAHSLALNGGAIRGEDGTDAKLAHGAAAQGSVAAGLSVGDARATEGVDAALGFAVTLSPASSGTVTVDYATADGTAQAGADYTAASGTLTFAPGETSKTVAVALLDDAHDEGAESFTLRLSNASGADIADAEATGTIVNSDPLQRAWLARFGRTAAGHVLAAVGERLSAAAESQVTIAGHRLRGPAGTPAAYEREAYARARAERLRAEPPPSVAFRELVTSSSFDVAAAATADQDAEAGEGARWTMWGRGAWSHFAGTDGALTLSGDVVTGTLGADYEQGRLLAGLAVAYSAAAGRFAHASGDSGDLHGSLASVHPYLRVALHERLALWGLFGYGLLGDLSLDVAGASTATETGVGMLMGAFGAHGTLLAAAPTGGFELAAKADGLLLRMRSQAAPGLQAAAADVTRWRLLLRGAYRGVPLFGGVLTPALEVGARYDGGAAETGAGLVVGGSLSYALPAWGLTLAAHGQGLLVHETGGFREWGAGGALRFDPGAPGRGLALRVAPSWGRTTTGVARLWSLPDAARLVAHPPLQPGAGLDAELSYGMDAPGGHGVVTPYAGIAQSEQGARTWRAGGRLDGGQSFSLSLEGTRRERAAAAPEHGLALTGTLSW